MSDDSLHNKLNKSDMLQSEETEFRIENKEDLVRHLVIHIQKERKETSQDKRNNRNLNIYYKSVMKDLSNIQAGIEGAYQSFKNTSSPDASLAYTSEWVLDNFYIINQAIRQIKEDLTIGFYRNLPKLIDGQFRGYPRIYTIAKNILAYQNLLFDSVVTEQIIIDLQKDIPLKIAEIWALPIFLRFSLLEYLAEALFLLIKPQTNPSLPSYSCLIPGIKDPLRDPANTSHGWDIDNGVANIILSMRAISELSWNDFFESVSLLEKLLHKDPAGVYTDMDFKTRDLYRNKLEKLSHNSGYSEIFLARYLLRLAKQFSIGNKEPSLAKEDLLKIKQENQYPNTMNDFINSDSSKDNYTNGVHIGEFLIGKYQKYFAKKIDYRPKPRVAILNWVFKHANGVYLGGVLFLTLLFLVISALFINFPQVIQSDLGLYADHSWNILRSLVGTPLMWVIAIILGIAMLIPAFTIATSLVNWFINMAIPPRILPKMDFKHSLPRRFSTMVVIPGMISSRKDINSLVAQIEMHYLRNSENGFQFAILTDFSDSDQEIVAEDAELVSYAMEKINTLNRKYAHLPVGVPSRQDKKATLIKGNKGHITNRFFFFHRKRLWNPSEGKWMGWERKRGKLHEFNKLIRGDRQHTFISLTDDFKQNPHILNHIRYVITLDDDTILPVGAGKRLVGTMAHPLNQPVFSEKNEMVISGYTILQPRMEIHPKSANRSLFTRLFAGDAGLDLYTLAVSDTYMDLFGEGIYVGKGIYDVDAFERSIGKNIPENTVLSHDLLEGNMGRAGLVTDITMVENYPPSYMAMILRQKRWIRGDWQLLPWLTKPNGKTLGFTIIDRWKIFDNLRRSLLAPALLFIFSFGLLFLPGLAGHWMLILILTLGVPLLTSVTRSTLQLIGGEYAGSALRPIWPTFLRWILAITFLVYEAYIAIDAILVTLYRLFISHKNLLQWTTAAKTARLLKIKKRRNVAWQKMFISVLFVLVFIIVISIFPFMMKKDVIPFLITGGMILLLWLFAPIVVFWINRPIIEDVEPLKSDQIDLLRKVVRRTWGFFERFVGPEDNWLPPDRFQETPRARIDHRTSPTNIGLLLTSTLTAYDFGYLDHLGLVTRLQMTTESMAQLERHRGHFLNWYNTVTQEALNPRYVSTVDSGNLAACLISVAQACQKMPSERIFRWELWQGYLDSLTNLMDILFTIHNKELSGEIRIIEKEILNLQAEIRSVKTQPDKWYPLFVQINAKFWPKITQQLLQLIDTSEKGFDRIKLSELKIIMSHLGQHQKTIDRSVAKFLPWVPFLRKIPSQLQKDEFKDILAKLIKNLPNNLKLKNHEVVTERALLLINTLLKEYQLSQQSGHDDDSKIPSNAESWLSNLEQEILAARKNVQEILSQYRNIAHNADKLVEEMNFRFLYNSQRRVFHIGFNLDAGILDNNYYDLLASEARIASIIAIAKGEIPQSHWLYLGRPATLIENINTLLSWSGTMFEYLLPSLFLRSYPGTLLADSAKGAVKKQITYAKSKGVPWGISESGFYRFDAGHTYQYQAFGVPGLGLKRDLDKDLVIAPYASLMAVNIDPQAVIKNLRTLIGHEMFGMYGLYEAIDFTHSRLKVNEDSAIVGEYMSHHQGMLLIALNNYLNDDIMVERMHGDRRIQSVELLLQEQVPSISVTQDVDTEESGHVSLLKKPTIRIEPWKVPVDTPIPLMHLLSNGHFQVLISNRGSGYISWRNKDLTRWQPDPVLENWGNWIYLQEMHYSNTPADKLWSATYQPLAAGAENMQVSFHAHMVTYQRVVDQLTSVMEVTVSPDEPVEIRRIYLQNNSNRPRRLRVTSYGEVVLATHSEDTQHPAFNKLFIESEYEKELGLQIFSRRPRTDTETPFLIGHMLMGKDEELDVHHEADRNIFIGRGHGARDPQALFSKEYLHGSSAATLDPIFALGSEITIAAHEQKQIAFLTFAAESKQELIALAQKFHTWPMVDYTFHQADINNQQQLEEEGLDSGAALENILKTFSALLYPYKAVRAKAEILAANSLGQSALWRFGISGDLPILLVMVDNPRQLELVREALLVFKYLCNRNFKIELVILNRQPTDYGAELNGLIHRLIRKTDCDNYLNLSAGVYVIYYDQMNHEERILLQSVARVILKGENGSLAEQLTDYSVPAYRLPKFYPSLPSSPQPALKFQLPDNLQFFNGYGGFSSDGKEYHILVEPNKKTPAPWVNVIGYPQFGFMVTEAGSQTTWAVNSGENRLTPWSNDPVQDPTGEALYLRDEETAEVWTPTPQPSNTGQPHLVRHGAGYTIFEHKSHGIKHSLTLYASPSDPVKIIRLKVTNLSDRNRRLTVTQYIEWVLGTTRTKNSAFIIPEYDFETESLLASNPYNSEFGQRTAFLSSNKEIHGMTADRTEFLGRAGTIRTPAALERLGLEKRITAGEDPCAALQVHIDLESNSSEEICFILGQGDDRSQAIELIKKYQQSEAIEQAFEETTAYWNQLLDTIEVETPDQAINLMLNRWSLYQSLSCRIWGRTAFYQSSGAYGFRDQLQDVLALLSVQPRIARQQILYAAAHQFEEGDVLHWWHPPTGRGVRTRFSDDLLWLPYVVAHYITVTADFDILDEETSFIHGDLLRDDEDEHYGYYEPGQDMFSLYEHCLRAIQKGTTKGVHGLPLIGGGDWNDGLNHVGSKGKGESIWLAWFLVDVLNRFAEICVQRGEQDRAEEFRRQAQEYVRAVEENGWDGAWYRRGYYDNGKPLGSHENLEGKIDAIAQSWAVISKGGNKKRSKTAMKSVLDRLVLPQERLSLLFAPPFDKTSQNPGYIKGYLPGIRENGGQYTHAAVWTAWAFRDLYDGNRTYQLFNLLNPIYQADSAEKVETYRVEPYVVCADIYSQEPYIRRGGWTWYTGSAAWYYRLGIEAILGFKKIGETLYFDPVIPESWKSFRLTYRYEQSVYYITVENPQHRQHGVAKVIMDGKIMSANRIPLQKNSGNHVITVIMG